MRTASYIFAALMALTGLVMIWGTFWLAQVTGGPIAAQFFASCLGTDALFGVLAIGFMFAADDRDAKAQKLLKQAEKARNAIERTD